MAEEHFYYSVNMHGLEVKNHRMHLLAADPGSPNEGDLWYNTVSHVARVRGESATRDLFNADDDFRNRLDAKTSIANADEVLISDSADSYNYKRMTKVNLVAGLGAVSNAYDRVTVEAGTTNLDASGEDTLAITGDGSVYQTVGSAVSVKTVTMTLLTQSANRAFMGPSSGGAATPTFRVLTDNDMPSSYSSAEWDAAYTHSQDTTGNPHNLDLGAQISGTPEGNQIAVWINDTTIEGALYFTISGSTLTTRHIISESTSAYTLGDNSTYWAGVFSDYIRLVDFGTNITRDGSNNLSFTDAVTGTATLADLVNQIDISGTPENNQLAIWTDSDTLEGDDGLTWTGAILDTTGIIQADTLNEHSAGAGITIDGGLLKDNIIGDSSNYWDQGFVRRMWMLHSGGSTATEFYVDNIDILYIKVGAGETWFDTASISNRIRVSSNDLGSNYYMSITGYQIEHFVNGLVVNKLSSSGIRTTGIIETDDIVEATADHGIEFEGMIVRDSYFEFSEIATPNAPAANMGRLYMDSSNEHIYFRTNSTTYDLTATGGGAGISWSGSGNNKIGTWVDANTINAEDNLQFDGSTLAITGTLTVSAISSSITQQRVLFYNSSTGVLSYGPDGGGGGTTYLRDDGTWVTPSGAGDVTATSYTQYDLAVWNSTAKNLIDTAGSLTWNGTILAITGTLTVSAITAGPAQNKVLFYNSSTGAIKYVDGGGSETEYLRGDGSFAVPAGSSEMVWTNGGSDRIGTYVDADTINAEANLTFSPAAGLSLIGTGSHIAKFDSTIGNHASVMIDGISTTDTLLTFQQAAVDKASIGWDVGTASFRISVGGSNVFTSLNKMAIFYPGAASELYYNNLKKLATTTTGIDVTGRAVVDGLTTSSHIYGASSIDVGSVTQYFRHGYFSGSVYADDNLVLNWETTPQTLDANSDGIYTTSHVGIGVVPSSTYDLKVQGTSYFVDNVGLCIAAPTGSYERVHIGGTTYIYGNESGSLDFKVSNAHATGNTRLLLTVNNGTDFVEWNVFGSTGWGTMSVSANTIYQWDGDGNMAIGGGTIYTDAQLSVRGIKASGYSTRFFNDGNNIDRYGISIQCGEDDQSQSGTQAYYIRCFDGDGGAEGNIIVDAGVLQFQQASDARRKMNIKDITLNISKILSGIRVREFNMLTKKGKRGGHQIGWIAQEVMEIYTPMASYDKATDFYGIKPGVIVPLLHRGWQLHEERLETHEQKIKRLEKRVKYLETKLKK